MNIIDGKAISKQIKDEVKEKVAALKAQGVTVTLAVVQVGNDPASSVYVNNKKKACAYTGMESESFELPEETTQEELLSLIEELNGRKEINGILVQLPLPEHIDGTSDAAGKCDSDDHAFKDKGFKRRLQACGYPDRSDRKTTDDHGGICQRRSRCHRCGDPQKRRGSLRGCRF